MQRSFTSLIVGIDSLLLGVLWLLGGADAQQQPPTYPLDEQLAHEPAPWPVKGKGGTRGTWGRWGEEDKRGMLNAITPKRLVKAAGLITQRKGVWSWRRQAQGLPIECL